MKQNLLHAALPDIFWKVAHMLMTTGWMTAWMLAGARLQEQHVRSASDCYLEVGVSFIACMAVEMLDAPEALRFALRAKNDPKEHGSLPLLLPHWIAAAIFVVRLPIFVPLRPSYLWRCWGLLSSICPPWLYASQPTVTSGS